MYKNWKFVFMPFPTAEEKVFFEKISSLIILIDYEGKIIYANSYAKSFFFIRSNSIKGLSVFDTIFENMATLSSYLPFKPDKNPENYSFVTKNLSSNGRYAWISWTVSEYKKDASIYIFLGNDITKCQEKNELYKSVFDNMLGGYAYGRILKDAEMIPYDYLILDVNDKYLEMTGLNRNDLLNRKITEIFPAIYDLNFDWISFFSEVALKNIKNETIQYFEPTNQWYKVTSYSPEKDHFIAIYENVSEYKKIIYSLSLENKIKLEYLIGAWESFIISDTQGKFSFSLDFDYKYNKVIKYSDKNNFPEGLNEAFKKTADSGTSCSFRLNYKKKKTLDLFLCPSFAQDNKVEKVYCFINKT
jgi:PAS domain S-box-containing protein